MTIGGGGLGLLLLQYDSLVHINRASMAMPRSIGTLVK
jgi:hypothetical protein